MAYQVHVMYMFFVIVIAVLMFMTSIGDLIAGIIFTVIGAKKKKKPMLIVGIVLDIVSGVFVMATIIITIALMLNDI